MGRGGHRAGAGRKATQVRVILPLSCREKLATIARALRALRAGGLSPSFNEADVVALLVDQAYAQARATADAARRMAKGGGGIPRGAPRPFRDVDDDGEPYLDVPADW